MSNVNLGNFYLSNQCKYGQSAPEKFVLFSCLLVVNFPLCLSGLVVEQSIIMNKIRETNPISENQKNEPNSLYNK
jgi:hypothetical protein